MPIALWQSLVEGVQAALEAREALTQARRTDRARPFAIAGSGFLLLLALGAFLHNTTVMAAATIPPALVAWWGAVRAWGTAHDRRPALAVGLLCLGMGGLLYTMSVVIPFENVSPSLAMDLFWIGVGAFAVGLALVLFGWFRDEWSSL